MSTNGIIAGIIVLGAALGFILMVISVRKSEEEKFQSWLDEHFNREHLDIEVMRGIFGFEKDPDKAHVLHSKYLKEHHNKD
jgi:G3E family GTPase